MKKCNIIRISTIILTAIVINHYVLFGVSQTEGALSFTDEISVVSSITGGLNATNWEDENWQFYKCTVEYGISAQVDLAYSGDLDLDLRLYWKRDNHIRFNGWDLTQCSINSLNAEQNSQLRTTDTSVLGEQEELFLTNPTYIQDQEGYILVFAYNGTGNSTYTLTSNLTMTKIEDYEVGSCEDFIELIVVYGLGIGGFLALMVVVSKKWKKVVTTPPEEKEARKEAKKKLIEEKKNAKLKKKGKLPKTEKETEKK